MQSILTCIHKYMLLFFKFLCCSNANFSTVFPWVMWLPRQPGVKYKCFPYLCCNSSLTDSNKVLCGTEKGKITTQFTF